VFTLEKSPSCDDAHHNAAFRVSWLILIMFARPKHLFSRYLPRFPLQPNRWRSYTIKVVISIGHETNVNFAVLLRVMTSA